MGKSPPLPMGKGRGEGLKTNSQPPDTAEYGNDVPSARPDLANLLGLLSNREREVLHWFQRDRSNKQISRLLKINVQ